MSAFPPRPDTPHRPAPPSTRRPPGRSSEPGRFRWPSILAPVAALALLHAAPGPSGALAGQTPVDSDAGGTAPADSAAVSRVLDALHDAAARADGDTYFGLFAQDGVFIGTDAGERWTVAEFRDYARPYFQQGQGWTYVPTERHVRLSGDGSTAWFDEMLQNEGLGLTRGTGVLVRENGEWRVAQYHLTIPVPNEIAGDVVEMIRDLPGDQFQR